MTMLQILVLTALLFKASASQISGDGNSTAEYGGNAHYRCTLANPAGVLQVTWQRLFKDQSVENLATYSKRFGEQVNEPYKGKVNFTQASLSSTSITLMNVTWEDESCYICSFNVYPDGSRRKQTCLTVQGISDVKTAPPTRRSAHEEEGVEEVVFSCSATGRPAPTIEWGNLPDASSPTHSPTETVANDDHTFTSSRNITLRVPRDWSGHVDCLLNSGMIGQRQERIPFSPSPEEEADKGKPLPSHLVVLLLGAVLLIFCVGVTLGIRRKRLKSISRTSAVDSTFLNA